MQLDDLLKDSEGIRAARAQERDPGALLPLGDSDDYVAPVQAKPLDLGKVGGWVDGNNNCSQIFHLWVVIDSTINFEQ